MELLESILDNYSNPLSFYQLIPWISVFLYAFSFQILETKKTLAIWIPANVFFAIHFFGMGSYPAMAVAVGSAVRETAAVFFSKKILYGVIITYTVFVWAVAIWLASGLVDYLPAIGTTFISIGLIFKDSFYKYRAWCVGHNLCWFIFYITIGSYAGTVQITLMFVSNIVGMGRYYSRQKNTMRKHYYSKYHSY